MEKLNGHGLIGTVLFHLLVAFLLIFFGFSRPDPPPEEEGILVNFGTDDSGFGYVEPAGDESQGGTETEVVETIGEVSEESVVESSVPTPTETVEEVVEEVQDFEESPVKENKPSPEEIRQKEIERQKAIEEERIRQEILEKQRKEEERRKQAEKIQQLGENAFGNKGVGTGSDSQGITEGTGNQGSLGGQPGVDNYGEGSGLGNGISHGFGNRRGRGTAPKPNVSDCIITNRTTVRVQIDLDSEGNVVGIPKILEASYQDDCIYNAVITAARATKFEASDKFKQRGWVLYIIEPQ